MLNRIPDMFAHTRLFIDRFHATSHKCADVFKLQAFGEYQELISTASESLNLFLQRFHGQAPFMTQATFMLLLSNIVGVRNYMLNKEMLQLQKQYK